MLNDIDMCVLQDYANARGFAVAFKSGFYEQSERYRLKAFAMAYTVLLG